LFYPLIMLFNTVFSSYTVCPCSAVCCGGQYPNNDQNPEYKIEGKLLLFAGLILLFVELVLLDFTLLTGFRTP
jgi:hypothetical protein